jgi:hypothetical protein
VCSSDLLTSIESWTPSTVTAANKVAVLPVALAGSVAVYYPPTNKVYVFGGTSAVTTVTTIYIYDIGTDAISTHATPMAVGLANAAGVYSPYDGKIYIVGGEKSDASMSAKIYSFNPATGAYIEETGIVTTYENADVEDGTTRPWAVPIGRNCACLVALDADDDGQVIMPGGRLTNSAGALTDAVYTLYPKDGIIGRSQYVNYGSLMGSTALSDTRMTTFYSDSFANLLGWDNSGGAWVASGGAAIGVIGAAAAWLTCLTPPPGANQRLLLNLEMGMAGALPDFKFALRAGFGGGALTDGYVVSYAYDGANAIWSLTRYNASVPTSLATSVDVTGDPLKQITSVSWRAFEFIAEELAPVHLNVVFNGYTLFDIYDFDAARITSTGVIGVYGGAL